MKDKTQNPLRKIKIEKISLNIGAGKNEDLLKKGLILLQKLSPLKPVKTITQKRIPGWGLRPGLAIGCKVTIRENSEALLKRLVTAKDNILKEKSFGPNGVFSFGIHEYIDIEGLEYDPDLKIIGFEVAVTLERPGFRVKKRKLKTSSVGQAHQITKEDALEYIKSLGIQIE